MKCILNQLEQAELLTGFTAGTLDSDTTRTYQRHLAVCPDCQRLVELQMEVLHTMSAWEAPAVSENFNSQLWARIRASEEPRSLGQRALDFIGWPEWSLPLRWSMAAVPVAALALVISFWPASEPALSPSLQAHEIQELERSLDDMEALQALHQIESDKDTPKGSPQETL